MHVCAPLRRAVVATVVASLTMGAPDVVRSQSAQPPSEKSWLIGGSVGVPSIDGEFFSEATLLGVHATAIKPGAIGLDVSASMAPRALTSGVIGGAITVGFAVSFEVAPDFLLLPTVGGTLAGAVGNGGTGGSPGIYAGASFATVRVRKLGLRAGLTAHLFDDVGAAVWLLEFGLVGGR